MLWHLIGHHNFSWDVAQTERSKRFVWKINLESFNIPQYIHPARPGVLGCIHLCQFPILEPDKILNGTQWHCTLAMPAFKPGTFGTNSPSTHQVYSPNHLASFPSLRRKD